MLINVFNIQFLIKNFVTKIENIGLIFIKFEQIKKITFLMLFFLYSFLGF